MCGIPKVTIVIPAFNAENYIKTTIDSCLSQTYKNIKVIVIDDNSFDRTSDVVLDYGKKVSYIKNEYNFGLPRNLNKVLLSDDSDFFIYLGHDDVLPPNHVEVMLDCFDESVVAVHCNSMKIDSIGKEIGYSKENYKQICKSRRALENLSQNNFISIVGMMHRTKAFQAVGGWDEKYDLYGEWLYYIKLLERGELLYCELTYAYYRIHEKNISKSLFSFKRNWSFLKYKFRCRCQAFIKIKNKTISLFYLFVYFQIRDFFKHCKQLLSYFFKVF